MRLDELPRSNNVEDRRGDGSGGFPMGRTGRIGIGTIVLLGLIGWALGINPLYLIGGAEILSGLGGSQQQSQPVPGDAKTEAPPDQMGEFVSAVLGSTEAHHVLRRYALGMRACAVRHGSVLLSERPEGLSRHRILSGPRAAFPWLRHRKQELPILPGLRDHARSRPPRAEFAWHPTPGPAGATRYGHG